MKKWMLINLVVLIATINGLAQQQSLMMGIYDTGFEHSYADPCKFTFTVVTSGSGPGVVTAYAYGSFSVGGSAGSVSGTHQAQATAEGSVVAKEVAEYSFPGFGTLSGQGQGENRLSGAGQEIIKASAGFADMECELFGELPPKPCQHVVVKRKEDDPCQVSPVVLDLDGDGFHFGGPDSAVFFDIYGSGTPVKLQWVLAGEGDAFLVHDIDGNGLADDGSELFGNGTRLLLENYRLAPNGFVALGQFDRPELGGNDDGLIDFRDEIWPRLSLWLDADADGHATFGEMIQLEDTGVHTLETIPRSLHQFDAWGNWLPYWATAYADSQTIDMVDVFFRIVD